MAGAYRPPRRSSGGARASRISKAQEHRRSGAKAGYSRRVKRALFRGRTVNAPRVWG